MTIWETWAAGVLAGVGAPLNSVSEDTLWAWSNAETAPYDLMRWNNPLNSTEPWPGARNSGAQPGPHDVKIYTSLNDGILATVATLENGFYPAIVANLLAGLPRQQWGAYSTAGAELHVWGTGTNWLQSTYGPAPGNLTGDIDVINDPTQKDQLSTAATYANIAVKMLEGTPVPGGDGQPVRNVLEDILAAVKGITPSAGPGPDLTALVQAVQANTSQVAAATTELNAISSKLGSLTLKAV